MVDAPLKLNCRQDEIVSINRLIKECKSRSGPPGLRLSGCPSSSAYDRVEGRLLAMACRLLHYDLKARVVLAAEVAKHLSNNEFEPLLQDEYLFIPDLQVWPAVFGCDQQLTERLFEALAKRVDRWLPTVTYFDTPNELGPAFEVLFSWWYRTRSH
jgi:hypothetical protein